MCFNHCFKICSWLQISKGKDFPASLKTKKTKKTTTTTVNVFILVGRREKLNYNF